jgi:glucose-6-phosphate-specific signal transduction histidine kinase
VTLRRDDSALHVIVTDDGPLRAGARDGQAGGASGGHGLRGLRERVTAHGGTFRAGPRAACADGAGGAYSARTGFEVCATLPVPEVPAGAGQRG